MKFYQMCCLLSIITCVLSKLIHSNTFEFASHLDILNDQIDLTIWIQIRWPIFLMRDESKLIAFRIADQNNQDQLLITIHTPDKQTIIIDYELQNQIRDSQSLYIKEMKYPYEWIQINSERNICFEKLYNNKINMSTKCDQQFNATLLTKLSDEILILIYDKMEFLNQEIILQDFPLIRNIFTFNIFKYDLKMLFYAMYYCNLEQEGVFYTQTVSDDSYINLVFKRDYIHIEYMLERAIQSNQIMQHITDQKIQQKIQYDQWLFCFISFNDNKVTIYLWINNERFQIIIQFDFYEMKIEKQNKYLFYNSIQVSNSQSLQWGNLLLINNIEQKINLINQDFFCVRECSNCGVFICQDDSNLINPQFTISEDIKLSKDYLNIFPNYQENVCTYRKFYLKDNICVEWPKYYGEYCFNCQIQQSKMNFQILDLILNLNYHYYLDKFYQIPENVKQMPIGFIIEQDLNIFIFKIKDIFLVYKTEDKFYCEDEYIYKGSKCVKQLKNCQLQQKDCDLCFQNYSLLNKKCIKCQKNCLNCRVINKKIYCVLNINDY